MSGTLFISLLPLCCEGFRSQGRTEIVSLVVWHSSVLPEKKGKLNNKLKIGKENNTDLCYSGLFTKKKFFQAIISVSG